MLRSHLTVLDSAVSRFASFPAFKLPQRDSKTGVLTGWNSITYEEFHRDVESVAKYWKQTLTRDNIPPRSVIGLWIGGWTYDDVLHVYGISRAGYIPQLFTIRLPNPVVIFELLEKSGAKALIVESSFKSVIVDSPMPVHEAISHSAMGLVNCTLSPLPEFAEEDVAFYLHTSGSTSGCPKVIPYTHRWLECTVSKTDAMVQPCKPGDVTTWMGSVCHVGQTSMFIGWFQHGACVLLPTVPAYSYDEFSLMVSSAKVNRISIFSPFLEPRLRAAKSDAKLLSLLQGLDDIIVCGGLLPRDLEEWSAKNNISVRNLFGSTECGATLISRGGYGSDSGHLRATEGVSYAFIPTGSGAEAAHQSTARLLEFVVLSSSPDCPPEKFRSPVDGHFHTGDLFQAVSPGAYVFRGRDDDWIKTENALRCDTKAVEDNVRITCGNWIGECVVVGWGRPSPALFVEPAGPALDMDHEKLKREILRKTRHFHSRRYLHERITSADLIIIVPPQSLPRTATKGNVRRKTTEEMFKTQLDDVYGRLART